MGEPDGQHTDGFREKAGRANAQDLKQIKLTLPAPAHLYCLLTGIVVRSTGMNLTMSLCPFFSHSYKDTDYLHCSVVLTLHCTFIHMFSSSNLPRSNLEGNESQHVPLVAAAVV